MPFLFSAFYIVYPSKMQEYVLEIPKEFREGLKNGDLWIMENSKKKVILPMTVLKRFDDILAPILPKKPLLKRLRNFNHKV